jgi:hypothetical protein
MRPVGWGEVQTQRGRVSNKGVGARRFTKLPCRRAVRDWVARA